MCTRDFMEKEQLEQLLIDTEKTFQDFFDFDTIFSNNTDGKVALNIITIKNLCAIVSNKMHCINDLTDEVMRQKISSINIEEILKLIESDNFNKYDYDAIMIVLNQLALKFKMHTIPMVHGIRNV